jgi:hypothetical protein
VAFDNTGWLIDGVLTKSELARRAQYAATGGADGVVGVGDLKVLPLSSPGNGVRISVGGATILNRYTTPVNQAYVVSNPTIETVDSTRMPASNPSARSHLVVATVGDPQYSATGHPWMLATDPPAGHANDFQYVRSHIIANVPSTTKRFEDLGLNYPGLALARLDIPGGSTTYNTANIIDLRYLSQQRSQDVQWTADTGAADNLTVTTPLTYEYWPDASDKAVDIPAWATVCYVDGWINGFYQNSATTTRARVRIGSNSMAQFTASSKYNNNTIGRQNVPIGGKISIPSAYRGTTQSFQMSATVEDAASQGKLTTDAWTNCSIHLRFVEEAV